MKKILLAIFVVSFAFISCTDNTEEHEELVNAIHATDKENNTTTDHDGSDTDNNEEG